MEDFTLVQVGASPEEEVSTWDAVQNKVGANSSVGTRLGQGC